nr:caspase family protein [uncultured Roseibium sp.]
MIIGNAKYVSLEDLTNTHADARAYREALVDLGFKATLKLDLDLDSTLDALDELLGEVAPGDEVAFVYSGHGWSDGAENFLLPVDAPKQGSDRQLRRTSIALSNGEDGLLDELEAAGVSLTVAIVDACRNNPFTPRPGKKSASLGRGLSPITAPHGTFVIFSAGSGEEALDRLPDDPPGEGLSVFTRTFVPLLSSGLYLEDAIAVAQEETYKIAKTYNGHQQQPSYYDETRGKTCLASDCKAGSAVTLPQQPKPDRNAFIRAMNEGTPKALQAFLDNYPESEFAGFVKERLESLMREAKAPPPEPIHRESPRSPKKDCAWRGDTAFCASSTLSSQGRNTYKSANLFDQKRFTAWVEGESGHGINEWISIEFPEPKAVEYLLIGNGYNKNNDIYSKNGRVHRAEISLSTGDRFMVTLKDTPRSQQIFLSNYPPVTWIQLKIVSVYEGWKYKDTAISELKVGLK